MSSSDSERKYTPGWVFERLTRNDRIKPGDKVKLDFQRITRNPNFGSLSDGFKSFVKKNRNRLFTVKFPPNHKNGVIVTFEEDDKYWFWRGDLIIQEEQDE